MAFVVAVVLTTLSVFIPIENSLITFSSPKTSYNYSHFGNEKLIVYGKDTAFIVGSRQDADVYAIIPKANTGVGVLMICEVIFSSYTSFSLQPAT